MKNLKKIWVLWTISVLSGFSITNIANSNLEEPVIIENPNNNEEGENIQDVENNVDNSWEIFDKNFNYNVNPVTTIKWFPIPQKIIDELEYFIKQENQNLEDLIIHKNWDVTATVEWITKTIPKEEFIYELNLPDTVYVEDKDNLTDEEKKLVLTKFLEANSDTLIYEDLESHYHKIDKVYSNITVNLNRNQKNRNISEINNLYKIYFSQDSEEDNKNYIFWKKSGINNEIKYNEIAILFDAGPVLVDNIIYKEIIDNFINNEDEKIEEPVNNEEEKIEEPVNNDKTPSNPSSNYTPTPSMWSAPWKNSTYIKDDENVKTLEEIVSNSQIKENKEVEIIEEFKEIEEIGKSEEIILEEIEIKEENKIEIEEIEIIEEKNFENKDIFENNNNKNEDIKDLNFSNNNKENWFYISDNELFIPKTLPRTWFSSSILMLFSMMISAIITKRRNKKN